MINSKDSVTVQTITLRHSLPIYQFHESHEKRYDGAIYESATSFVKSMNASLSYCNSWKLDRISRMLEQTKLLSQNDHLDYPD